MPIKILIVDDDPAQRKLCKDAIDLFNKGGHELVLDEAISKEEGLSKLRRNEHDGAIVDLRLAKQDKDGEGNEIIREIRSTMRVPIRIVSGHLGDLDDDLGPVSFFYKTYARDQVQYDEIFGDFVAIHATGITDILNNRGRIEKDITDIFWKHISALLPEFIAYKANNNEWDIEKVLLRYIAVLIHEYLELDAANRFESFSDLEFYIKPPVRALVFTGDVLKRKDDDSHWVVLTPACDLATDIRRAEAKAELITLARIESADAVLAGKNANTIQRLQQNSMDLKYHFLPSNSLFTGGFVNFQSLLCTPTGTALELFDVEVAVSPSFRKDIVFRFSNYYGRQGQPSLSS
jgi:CheY-like chemotaxis protein